MDFSTTRICCLFQGTPDLIIFEYSSYLSSHTHTDAAMFDMHHMSGKSDSHKEVQGW